MKRIKLTNRARRLLESILSGKVEPFMYKNKGGKDCFIDVSAKPSLLGNLYFTISIRALIKNKLLYCEDLRKSIDVECLIKGTLDKKEIKGQLVKPTGKALHLFVGGEL